MQREPWESCFYCHGEDGAIASSSVPAIAGQRVDYLRKQLTDFKAGRRRDPERQMASALALLDARDIPRVADYFAALPAPAGSRDRAANPTGARLYHEGRDDLPACVTCHGDRSIIPFDTPRLQGLSATYLARQLDAFRTGERDNDPDGVMRGITARLDGHEIDALVDYLAGDRTAGGGRPR